MITAIPIVIAYLLGGIPFGLLIPRLFGVPDIRRYGSGNIGATNATRVLGFRKAAWVYAGDILKGVAAVMIGRWFVSEYGAGWISVDGLLLLCALAAVLGHLFPVYLRFRGGKGVNTALGVMLALLPLEALIGLAVFAAVAAASKYVSLGSMLGTLGFFGALLVRKYFLGAAIADVYVWVSGLMLVLIVVAHRQNIGRLMKGTESRISEKGARREKVEPHA